MSERIDWHLLSFEGNRRAQHAAFNALTFREKVIRLEQMAEVQRHFNKMRVTQDLTDKPKQPG